MKFAKHILTITVVLLALMTVLLAQEATVDYQRIADNTAFGWSKEQSSAFCSLIQYQGRGEVQLARNGKDRNIWGFGLTIRFVDDDKVLLSIAGHNATVFQGVGDVVYYASYSPRGQGCTVIAYDLTKQKQLWKTELTALSDFAGIKISRNSHTFNYINLNAGTDYVGIYGHETHGDYLEYLDARTGKPVGHKIYRPLAK